ncbi:unnamed protein product [Heterobilharzia americana]|nr:unnamed protein product [Heterobilharzia americana]
MPQDISNTIGLLMEASRTYKSEDTITTQLQVKSSNEAFQSSRNWKQLKQLSMNQTHHHHDDDADDDDLTLNQPFTTSDLLLKNQPLNSQTVNKKTVNDRRELVTKFRRAKSQTKLINDYQYKRNHETYPVDIKSLEDDGNSVYTTKSLLNRPVTTPRTSTTTTTTVSLAKDNQSRLRICRLSIKQRDSVLLKTSDTTNSQIKKKHLSQTGRHNEECNEFIGNAYFSHRSTEHTDTPHASQSLHKFDQIPKEELSDEKVKHDRRQRLYQKDPNCSTTDKSQSVDRKLNSPQLIKARDKSLSSSRLLGMLVTDDVDGGEDDFEAIDYGEEDDAIEEEEEGNDDDDVDVEDNSFKILSRMVDLPKEIPNRLVIEQVKKPLDINSVNWPYETSNHRIDSTISDHIDTGMKQTADTLDPNNINATDTMEYLNFAEFVKSLIPFHIIAYPDLTNATGSQEYEPFYTSDQAYINFTDDHKMSDQQPEVLTTSQSCYSLSSLSSRRKISKSQDTTYKRMKQAKSCIPKRSAHSVSKIVESIDLNKPINRSISSNNKHSSRLPYDINDFPHIEILDDIRRLIDPDDLINRVVYDLDELIVKTMKDVQLSQQQQQHQQLTSSISRSSSPKNLSHFIAPFVNIECDRCTTTAVLTTGTTTTVTTIPSLTSLYPTELSSMQIFSPKIQVDNLSMNNCILNMTKKVTGSTQFVNHLYPPTKSPLSFTNYHVNLCELSNDVISGDSFVLSNRDELLVDHFDFEKGHLKFESRFECGNLRKVIQVRQYEYDLILNPDVNTLSNLQWFYFRVSNMESNVPYRFNIVNCEKVGSQFSSGMQPLLFSVREALESRPHWRRVGSHITYYRNHFIRQLTRKRNIDGGTYYTASFMIRFPYTGDVCYLAYHYPYTYTRLLTDLNKWQNQTLNNSTDIYFRIQQLTSTILCNPVPLITITQNDNSSDESTGNNQRRYIVITCRVHSGESNSSWVMKGLLQHLLSNDDMKMIELRKMFIFKIVPMLNPDGVISGNHRCSMSGKDLNRHWINPSPSLHPTIYHTKMLLQLLSACERAPYIFIDLHGHSRMKNIFLYGCSSSESWRHPDIHNPAYRGPNQSEDVSYRALADILDKISPSFSKESCLYVVSKAKETTARIAIWREFNVLRSYTIEASYCGIYRKWQGIQHFENRQWQQDSSEEKQEQDETQKESVLIQHQIQPTDLIDFGSKLLDAFLVLPKYEIMMMSNDDALRRQKNIEHHASSLSSSSSSSSPSTSSSSSSLSLSPSTPHTSSPEPVSSPSKLAETEVHLQFDNEKVKVKGASGTENL